MDILSQAPGNGRGERGGALAPCHGGPVIGAEADGARRRGRGDGVVVLSDGSRGRHGPVVGLVRECRVEAREEILRRDELHGPAAGGDGHGRCDVGRHCVCGCV